MARVSLKNVERGRQQRPIRILVYGEGGRGKSSFAAEAPEAIFLDLEEGTHELNIARSPSPKVGDTLAPWSW